MTLETAKKLYIAAGGRTKHYDSEWQDIHKEMEAIINATSDRKASNVIRWWGCWDEKYTPTAFARRVRDMFKLM